LNGINDSGSDSATVAPVTDLVITEKHVGNFTQGDTGKIYTITVRNAGGLPTTGSVTVNANVPAGLTTAALSGTGWSCTLGSLMCTRSDVLGGSANYPAILLTVNVAAKPPGTPANGDA